MDFLFPCDVSLQKFTFLYRVSKFPIPWIFWIFWALWGQKVDSTCQDIVKSTKRTWNLENPRDRLFHYGRNFHHKDIFVRTSLKRTGPMQCARDAWVIVSCWARKKTQIYKSPSNNLTYMPVRLKHEYLAITVINQITRKNHFLYLHLVCVYVYPLFFTSLLLILTNLFYYKKIYLAKTKTLNNSITCK